MRKLPRVLIVEDEPAIAELISVNLRHNGFQPFWAEDGEAAQRELDAPWPERLGAGAQVACQQPHKASSHFDVDSPWR